MAASSPLLLRASVCAVGVKEIDRRVLNNKCKCLIENIKASQTREQTHAANLY